MIHEHDTRDLAGLANLKPPKAERTDPPRAFGKGSVQLCSTDAFESTAEPAGVFQEDP